MKTGSQRSPSGTEVTFECRTDSQIARGPANVEEKEMEMYQGSCHCGAVRFSFESEAITKGLRCNCSLCARKGAMMTPEVIAPQDFKIDAQENALGIYQFGPKTAKHYFCTRCGIYTFHETARVPGHFRANLGCIDGIDTFSLGADIFDGKHLL